MVRSESADEYFASSTKAKISNSGNEDDDDCSWSHTTRSASSFDQLGGVEPPNAVISAFENNLEMSDRRMRRQIANCNERRRMQSINAGFQSLRSLLPKKDGEKLSKAAILQQTAELIQNLKAEKSKLIEDKEAALNIRKRKIKDDEVHERSLVDELTSALEQERRLRQLYEQRLLDLRSISPLLSHISLGSQANSMPIMESACPSTPALSPAAGLLPHSLMLDDLVTSRAISSIRQQSNGQFFGYNLLPVPGGFVANSSSIVDAKSAPSINARQSTLLMNSVENESAVTLSHRNLNAILEAIRQLEGANESSKNTPTSVNQKQANVLVR